MAANTIIAMTGNMGIPGGFAGGLMRPGRRMEIGSRPTIPNPVDRDSPPRKDSLFMIEGASNVESDNQSGGSLSCVAKIANPLSMKEGVMS